MTETGSTIGGPEGMLDADVPPSYYWGRAEAIIQEIYDLTGLSRDKSPQGVHRPVLPEVFRGEVDDEAWREFREADLSGQSTGLEATFETVCDTVEGWALRVGDLGAAVLRSTVEAGQRTKQLVRGFPGRAVEAIPRRARRVTAGFVLSLALTGMQTPVAAAHPAVAAQQAAAQQGGPISPPLC